MHENNQPCECGHSKINHINQQFYIREKNTVDTRKGCGVRGCSCNEFKMDNLRFLEKENDYRKS